MGLLSLVLAFVAAFVVSEVESGANVEVERLPTLSPTTSREFTVKEAIGLAIGEEKLNTKNSVYEEALNWIVNDDPLQLVPSDDNLIQRFIMVVFYLKTSGDNWLS